MFIWPDTCGCESETISLQEQAIRHQAEQARLLEAARRKVLDKAGLIGWLGDAEFDHFQPRADWPEAIACKDRAQIYFEALENDAFVTESHPIYRPHKKNWLIMHGHFGCGKTMLAAAMVKWFTGNGNAYFRVWPDYERRIRATYGKDEDGNSRATETENDIISELQKGEFVVIDDLDKRKSTDFTRGVLYSVLNYRYNAELPTVLTFNYGPDEFDRQAPGRLILESILGAAALDRVIGCAFDVIDFNGPSFRSGVTW
jgi:DNA replication protein DnaC